MGFNKSYLLFTVSLSFLLLSTHAISSIIAPSPSPFPTHTNTKTKTIDSIFKKALSKTQNMLKSPNPKVLDFCKSTENPTLCGDTIAPFFQGSFFDPIKALLNEVEATHNQTLKVADVIANTLNDPNTNRNAREPLDICRSRYKSIVSTIKEAVELLNQQNVVDAYYKFSSVISDQTTCEDAFVESPGAQFPFPDDSLTVYQLAGNCLAIMDEIVNSHNQFFFA
ncbi:hypothetical protein AAZX31_03G200400 [Glycine max]|uniref:Pectinesterase inhibitor domain-containing protein n=2 Tax=Glycine subgen. Soja TaxID=1462606 RepID=I1JQT2_SOYBN|nr:uncharacterized protein LOC102660506 [Glycine max]XP_028226333.1 uncharacterized protein LOC114407436 [Glycine soja]KAG5044134.1 hypothetical protein JHK87_008049 [Glycine soja]KAG5055931.1 hypothetical protein JHK85_008441 [Glycine max]KAG5072991.1 hypothetical protein JHK86_008202 [Glycine max]KAH1071240.1 hypothetical protein GYH30_008013 [Glycine max]KAH1259096.1 hypothetical protein GmHk_03G008652 [Glycine max]|eukprot:XP_006577170.1 uncharacterized protein LOC102660506 [Glycine max]